VIEARALTKDYGEKRAVDDLTFTVQPESLRDFSARTARASRRR